MSTRQLNPAQIEQIKQTWQLLLQRHPEMAGDEKLIEGMFEGSTDAFEVLRKVENWRQEVCTLAGAIAGRIATLDARLGRYERQESGWREVEMEIMGIAGLRKAELPEATLSIRPSPPKVIINDDTEIPELYWRIRKEPMKVEIKEALKIGKEIPGCTLSNQPDTLSIRTK